MCNFFSCLAFRTGTIRFCEMDQHDTLISRLGLRDNGMGHFVRVEVEPKGDGWGPVVVDETTVPGWWSEDQAAWEDRVRTVAERVRPAQAVFNEAMHPTWVVYDEAVRPAWAVFDEATRPAQAAFNEATHPAWVVYDEAVRPAWAVFDEATRPAQAAYDDALRAAQAVYVRKIRTIEGYVPSLVCVKGDS